MNRTMILVLACLAIISNLCAKELLPWEIEHVSIAIPGSHVMKIDDRVLSFDVPIDLPTKSFRAAEVITRGGKFDDWLKSRGVYEKDCFGESWNFYPLGIPFFGSSAKFSILAKIYVKASPDDCEFFRGSRFDCADFSKPEDMFEYFRRRTNYYVDKSKHDRRTHLLHYYSPVEEVVINSRRWFHYYINADMYPEDLGEYYVTGLAPDRYMEIYIRQYPVPLRAIGYPYPATGYPTYPTEDQMPGWMKKTHKYREQVINSIRITRPAGSNEPDLYEVEAATNQQQSTGAASQLISPGNAASAVH
ncbi:MAG: hypothetical protein Q7U94_06795 [Sideroxyarcus sp.]|nr:hypothetical protein [Sideroxyarcus sp.]